jgi:glycosyltransferase involved in cell wall biosynthesis
MNLKDELTIVIPCKNEEKYIGNTLSSIQRQKNIEGVRIIIADAESTDNTIKVINQFRKLLNIQIIKGGSVSFGRNEGAKLSKTNYILFLDADATILDKNNIYYNVLYMKLMRIHLMTCRIKGIGYDYRLNIGFRLFNLVNKFISYYTPFATGTYFLTETDRFFEYGMFNEEYHQSEDYMLSKRYNPEMFKISPYYVGQDDRRFKKMGYLGMVKLLILGYINRNNPEFFKKDVGYWD